MRIGMGYDVHRLVTGRDLILGGVKIPYEKGLLGHSDADVLLHAIMDALLGAAAMGDIGKHFPDTDPKYEGVSSLGLLKQVGQLLEEEYLSKDILTTSDKFYDFIVPEGYIFAMGDNRPKSTDCRDFGCIPIEKIEGIVVFRFWPLDTWGSVKQ